MRGTFFGDDSSKQAYVSLNVVFCSLGTAISILMLMLIRRMHVRKGHVTLIMYMTLFQCLYDVTLFFSNVYCGYYITAIAVVGQIVGGITSSLISNWIAFVAFYIIVFHRSCDVFRRLPFILSSSILPSIATAIGYMIATIPQNKSNDALANVMVLDVYFYIRAGSIVLNFLFCGIAFLRIQRMSSNNSTKSPQEAAIRTLATRMVYYPIVQAICRSGDAWYELQFGSDFAVDKPDSVQYGCLIFLTIITPLVDVGYLIIFLVMQPDAFRTFLELMCCRDSRASVDDTISVHVDDFSDDSNEPSITTNVLHESSPSVVSRAADNKSVFSISTAKSSQFETRPHHRDMRDDDELIRIIQQGQTLRLPVVTHRAFAASRPTESSETDEYYRTNGDSQALSFVSDRESTNHSSWWSGFRGSAPKDRSSGLISTPNENRNSDRSSDQMAGIINSDARASGPTASNRRLSASAMTLMSLESRSADRSSSSKNPPPPR